MTDIQHFGVKGMHWGVRKAMPGPSGTPAKKVLSPAEKSARRRMHARRIALAGAALIVAGPEVMGHTIDIINSSVGHQRERKGAKVAAGIFADSKGLPNFQAINLTFNSRTNTWE